MTGPATRWRPTELEVEQAHQELLAAEDVREQARAQLQRAYHLVKITRARVEQIDAARRDAVERAGR